MTFATVKKYAKQKAIIDIVNEILEACILAYPVSSFVISLYQQYQQRGSLSKKQLQGLYSKAAKIEGINSGKLATLEALINKMPTRFKSELPELKPMFEKDKSVGDMLNLILSKYPQHKAILFLKAKYDNNETLSSVQIVELKRLLQLLK
ncbi:MAG: hypothetical protein IPJ81_18365 [Chitinophagaceae bacterium]|nr:hypothetical protein [Chitinophagaceae bacterium]